MPVGCVVKFSTKKHVMLQSTLLRLNSIQRSFNIVRHTVTKYYIIASMNSSHWTELSGVQFDYTDPSKSAGNDCLWNVSQSEKITPEGAQELRGRRGHWVKSAEREDSSWASSQRYRRTKILVSNLTLSVEYCVQYEQHHYNPPSGPDTAMSARRVNRRIPLQKAE